jgi:hypothetical protein
MFKTALLEVVDGKVMYLQKSKNILSKNMKKSLNVRDIRNINVNLKYRNITVLIHGEEIYIENMIIPKVRKIYIYNLVEDRLREKFKDINNIMFSYEIVNSSRVKLDIRVMCINSDCTHLIKKFTENNIDINGIVPVQLYVLNKYKNKINSDNYIFVTEIRNLTYFIACSKDKVLFNEIFHVDSGDDFLYCLDEFKLKLNLLIPNIDFKHMEFLNFPYKDVIKNISCKCSCNDLGEIVI